MQFSNNEGARTEVLQYFYVIILLKHAVVPTKHRLKIEVKFGSFRLISTRLGLI